MMIAVAKLREKAEALAAVSRFSVLRYKRISYDQRWAVYYALMLAADEIENLRAEVLSLRSRLEAVVELASVGTEE